MTYIGKTALGAVGLLVALAFAFSLGSSFGDKPRQRLVLGQWAYAECGYFLAENLGKFNNDFQQVPELAWVEGYATARDVEFTSEAPGTGHKAVDIKDQEVWDFLTEYCQRNPYQTLAFAADALIPYLSARVGAP